MATAATVTRPRAFDFSGFARRYGLPSALLCAVLYGVWTGLVKPAADQQRSDYSTLLRTTVEAVQQQTAIQREMAGVNAQIAATLRELREQNAAILREIREAKPPRRPPAKDAAAEPQPFREK